MLLEPDLLVMSVYNRESLPWMPLQKQFLDSTTTSFDFAVFLNHIQSTEIVSDIKVIGTNFRNCEGPEEHILGLKALLQFARSTTYRYFLVLDSDCFPIASWQAALTPYLDHYDGVSVMRVENCSAFPHPCMCYFADPNKIDFEIQKHHEFTGDAIHDITCVLRKCFPLLRTNRRNRHLLAAAVYFDLFYHHGCGSRQFYMRSIDYYGNIVTNNEDPNRLQEELFADPITFLATLVDL